MPLGLRYSKRVNDVVKVTLSRALLQTVKRSIAAGYATWVAFLDPSASLRMTASQFLREFVMLPAVKHLIKEYREQSTEYRNKMAPVSSRRISYPLYPGTILVAASFVPPLREGVGGLKLCKQSFDICPEPFVRR